MSGIGKISKIRLEKVNKLTIESTKLNERKNTDIITKWVKIIENKGETSFIIFDTEIFYSSISPGVIQQDNDSIDFPKAIHNISDNDLNIIMNTRKMLLFHDEEPWIEKNGE